MGWIKQMYGHQEKESPSSSTFSASPTTKLCKTCHDILDEVQQLSPEGDAPTDFDTGENIRERIQRLVERYRPLKLARSSTGSTTQTTSSTSSLPKFKLRAKPPTDIYDFVALSSSGQVMAAAMSTKLVVKRVKDHTRNVVQLSKDQQIGSLAASDSFVAVGSDAGFELYSVSDATLSFTETFNQTVKAIALFHSPDSEDFVSIGTGKMVYHSRIVKKHPTEGPGFKLAIEDQKKWVGMRLDVKGGVVASIAYSHDASRICVGTTNGEIRVFNIDGTLFAGPHKLQASFGENNAFAFSALQFIDINRVIVGVHTDTGNGGDFPAIIDFTPPQPIQCALRADSSEKRATIKALCVSDIDDGSQVAFVEAGEIKAYHRYKADKHWKEVSVSVPKIPDHTKGSRVALVLQPSRELLVLDNKCDVRTLRISS